MFGLPPRLLRVVSAYTINQFGNWFGYVALALVVYDRTHSALAVAALLAAAQAIPGLCVPTLVARVERSRRKRWLGVIYGVEAVVTASLALALHHFSLAAVLILAVIDGLAALTAKALVRAAAARIGASGVAGAPTLDAADSSALGARRANSALNSGFTVATATGPAIAGLFVAFAGGPAALLVDAGSFLVCGWLVRGVVTSTASTVTPDRGGRLSTGLAQVRRVPGLLALLAAEGLALLAFESAAPVEVLYAKSSLHAGDRGYGVLIAVWGIGQIVGSVVFARWIARSLRPLLVGGTVAVGVAYLGFGAAPSLGFAFAAAFIGGVGNGVQWAAFISAAQELTPSALHGRLMAAIESLGAMVPAFAFTLGGVVAALTTPRTELWLAGSLACIVTVAVLRVTSTLHGDPSHTERDAYLHDDATDESQLGRATV